MEAARPTDPTLGESPDYPGQGNDPETQPIGFLLHPVSLLVLIGILGISTYWGITEIVLLSSLLLVVAGFTRAWGAFSVQRIKGGNSLAEHRVFPGEIVQGELRVTNNKPLPLPWAHLHLDLPPGLSSNGTGRSGGGDGSRVNQAVSLPWYSSAVLTFPCTAGNGATMKSVRPT